MSYTLNQVEKFALAETRRIATTQAVRDLLGLEKGEYLDSNQAYGTISSWTLAGNSIQRTWAIVCLNGGTLKDFQLYCRIEQQRCYIRRLEIANSSKEYSEHLKVARADFKSYLKEVQL